MQVHFGFMLTTLMVMLLYLFSLFIRWHVPSRQLKGFKEVKVLQSHCMHKAGTEDTKPTQQFARTLRDSELHVAKAKLPFQRLVRDICEELVCNGLYRHCCVFRQLLKTGSLSFLRMPTSLLHMPIGLL